MTTTTLSPTPDQKPIPAPIPPDVETRHDRCLARLSDWFAADPMLITGLLRTDADPVVLWEAYLAGFDESYRQHYNCNACRRFIAQFGGLVTVDDAGEIHSPLWEKAATDPIGGLLPFAMMNAIVRRSKITGVLVQGTTDPRAWGEFVTGDWHHLAVHAPPLKHQKHTPIGTGRQYEASRREDFNTVRRALGEFSLEKLDQALAILKSESLANSAAIIGQAQWLRDRKAEVGTGFKQHGVNLLWRAILNAPPGFCHPRSGMLGTLLDDLATSLPFDDVKARWAAKMHPLKYQRPTAAPSSQTVAQAVSHRMVPV